MCSEPFRGPRTRSGQEGKSPHRTQTCHAHGSQLGPTPLAPQACHPAHMLMQFPAYRCLSCFPSQDLPLLCRRMSLSHSIFHRRICHSSSQVQSASPADRGHSQLFTEKKGPPGGLRGQVAAPACSEPAQHRLTLVGQAGCER